MSKIVCDICGTSYDDASGSCPVCGWSQDGVLPADSGDFDADFFDDLQDDAPAAVSATAAKGKVAFDYDAVNGRGKKAPKPAKPAAPEDDDDENEEESGSNTFLVIILVLLILALLAVSGYIGYTKILKPRQMGSDVNKPQETISQQETETTAPTEAVTIATEATEPTIPCTGLNMVGNMETLTYAGQYWRLMVKAAPDNTTDKIVYTSGDDSVVTIDEYGRVTAVGEGETTITITCGSETITTTAVVNYKVEETTAPTTTIPASPDGTVTPAATTTPVAPGTALKLKKTDITIGRRGVYVTLEVDGGIAAEDVKWSTSDSKVATVYNGNVTALSRGTCVITAEYNGQTAQCVVRCKF